MYITLKTNMLIVKVFNGNIDQALKKLKTKVRNTKQVQFLRDRQEFTKPSVSRRLQKRRHSTFNN